MIIFIPNLLYTFLVVCYIFHEEKLPHKDDLFKVILLINEGITAIHTDLMLSLVYDMHK